jgi:hypothetical protein
MKAITFVDVLMSQLVCIRPYPPSGRVYAATDFKLVSRNSMTSNVAWKGLCIGLICVCNRCDEHNQ